MLCQLNEGRERIFLQPNVRVKHTEIVARGNLEGGIVVRAEALGCGVVDEVGREDELPRIEIVSFRQVPS